MSQNRSTAASSSKFRLIINDALKVYNKRTKNDLLLHPLAAELQSCESPTHILAVLQQQVQGIDHSRSGDDRWTKWLDPTINVLLTFSQTAGTVGLVCPRTSAYPRSAHSYLLVGVLTRDGSLCRNRRPPFSAYSSFLGVGHSNIYGSQAAKDVCASHETLLDIFGRIEMFFRRLEMYTEVPLTTEMTDVIIEIMAEVLSIVGIATKDIKQGRTSKQFMHKYVFAVD
jgi:hypothetical protein